jgi:hypothetical protein
VSKRLSQPIRYPRFTSLERKYHLMASFDAAQTLLHDSASQISHTLPVHKHHPPQLCSQTSLLPTILILSHEIYISRLPSPTFRPSIYNPLMPLQQLGVHPLTSPSNSPRSTPPSPYLPPIMDGLYSSSLYLFSFIKLVSLSF